VQGVRLRLCTPQTKPTPAAVRSADWSHSLPASPIRSSPSASNKTTRTRCLGLAWTSVVLWNRADGRSIGTAQCSKRARIVEFPTASSLPEHKPSNTDSPPDMVLNIDFFRPSDDPDAIGPDQVRQLHLNAHQLHQLPRTPHQCPPFCDLPFRFFSCLTRQPLPRHPSEQLREAQKKRFKDPEIIDKVIAADEGWRKCKHSQLISERERDTASWCFVLALLPLRIHNSTSACIDDSTRVCACVRACV
jgi:hypothetical protein